MTAASRLLEADRQRAWEAMGDLETYYELRDGKLHDKWAPVRLLAVGEITAEEFEAARRFNMLVERHAGQGKKAKFDRVDGGLGDYHARPLDQMLSGWEMENAYRFVLGRTTAVSARIHTRKRTMDELFRHPHMTFYDMRRVKNEASHVTTMRVKACVTLLAIYFKKTKRDRENWNGRR